MSVTENISLKAAIQKVAILLQQAPKGDSQINKPLAVHVFTLDLVEVLTKLLCKYSKGFRNIKSISDLSTFFTTLGSRSYVATSQGHAGSSSTYHKS